MFPNRTFLYDQEEDEIIPPENSAPYLLTADGEPIRPRPSTEGKVVWVGVEDRFIPLASTGLRGAFNEQEIIEGHIMEWSHRVDGKSDVGVVCWRPTVFSLYSEVFEYGLDLVTAVEDYGGVVIGHALTDPDLVPDSFDVGEYFGLEGQD